MLPLTEALDADGNSPSPFANLKDSDDEGDEKPSSFLWRTKSLDDGFPTTRRTMSDDDCGSDENNGQGINNSVVAALHSSFDASLLDGNDNETGMFRPIALAGKKHAASKDEDNDFDVAPPGTVRKLRRRHDALRHPESKSTPGRKTTPTSAARRTRRMQRRSPHHHHHQSAARIPPTMATPFKFANATDESPVTPRMSLFGASQQQTGTTHQSVLTPTRAAAATPLLPPLLPQTSAHQLKTKPVEQNTGTTVNSSFDALHDTDATSPTSTPFRFTSFPASLPRVNNARDRNYQCPTSTKKYMSFSAFASATDQEVDVGDRKVGRLSLSRNSSQEEDGTHNSSWSSLSADAVREPAPAHSTFQQKAMELKSPQDAEMKLDRKESIDSEVLHGETQRMEAVSSVQSKLFGDDDEDLIASPTGPGDGSESFRARLDFNQMISPTKHGKKSNARLVMYTFGDGKDVDLSRPYEQRKTSSFPSTTSSTTTLRNISGFEDESGATPSRPDVIHIAEHDQPLSPDEQVHHYHFHVDASQCSPIPGISEDSTAMDTDEPTLEPRIALPPIRERPPRSAPRKRSQRRSSTTKKGSPDDDVSKHSVSNESVDGGSSTSSKMRRLRPMPDITAFEVGVSSRSASSSIKNERSTATDESSSGAMDSFRAAPPSPQLVCPPTPLPAWVYQDAGQKSLITTEVLAICPAKVLDGHSSLENSLMDDDEDSQERPLFGRRPSSISAVLEEDDFEGDPEPGPMRDLSDLHEMLTTSSSTMPRLTRHSSAPLSNMAAPPPPALERNTSCIPRVAGYESFATKSSVAKTAASPRHFPANFGEVGSVISFSNDFDNLGMLGRGTFADVYKVRSKLDGKLYAVKRNRYRFRGKRDREMALAEVRIMQRLQSVCAQSEASSSDKKERAKNSLYLLFFFRAWQQDGHFFSQTELCCRHTCREMRQALGARWTSSQRNYSRLLRHFPSLQTTRSIESDGQLVPMNTVFKICHDVLAGLSHIHSHGVVHNDIKSSNILLVPHSHLGAMLKIGDFGMAGDVGTSEDGQEGDAAFMAPELLSSGAVRHPSADIFSLGLTLYEVASSPNWELPSEGIYWQNLRNGSHTPELPPSRDPDLSYLIQAMINPNPQQRPTADDILARMEKVKEAGNKCDEFLRDYIRDIEDYDRVQDERRAMEQLEADERCTTPRNANGKALIRDFRVRSPTPTIPIAPSRFTPEPASKNEHCFASRIHASIHSGPSKTTTQHKTA